MRQAAVWAAGFFGRIAGHKALCCLSLGAFVLALRAALLPIWPIPQPTIYDEFCYGLQADTFAHGRLTNPTHPLWPFFESIYVLQRPSYTAKYQPAQGFVMALGQKITGHAWFGVWLSCGVLAALVCWAAQGWLPPLPALAAGILVLQLCFYSYWMNSYWGGAVPGIGGCLVLGAWGRLRSGPRRLPAALVAAGAMILLLSRPYEGTLLILPVFWMLRQRLRSPLVWAPMALILGAGISWTAFYNYRVTGNAWRLPYHEYFLQYETVPQFNILPVSSGTRELRHRDFELLDKGWLLDAYQKARSPRFPLTRAHDWYITLKHLLGGVLPIVPLLVFGPVLLIRKETRPLAFLALVMVAGSFVEVAQYPHYAAPFLAVFAILAAQALRRMGPAGAVLLVASLAYAAATDAVAIYRRSTPDRFAANNARKSAIERRVASANPRGSVIFVRYTSVRIPHEEWIYNEADIDRSPVIWAQDMGEAENRRLIEYFAGRAMWLFQPDESLDTLTAYP